MEFSGHDLYKINKNWLFDLTTFVCYKVWNKGGKIIKAVKCFKVIDKNRDANFEYVKYTDDVPMAIYRKSSIIIKDYYKEALICERIDY